LTICIELDDTISKDYQTHTLIDNALRSYLTLATTFRSEYVKSDYDVARCSYMLQSSPLFQNHADYIRRQIVQCLLEDDDPSVLRVSASFLLADARQNESTFELMNKEGAFRRLVDLISDPRQQDEEAEVHRMLMELLYEMSRIQKITTEDLLHVQDGFVTHLFDIIEQISGDVHDPYHYPVIRVVLVLSEQFMVAAHEPTSPNTASTPLTNKVIKVLSSHGSDYKSFGENIILLLNREDETSLQLLTLKLLYLLFTTPPTYEYFYTNDLRVLVDILIRNLLDLPEDAAALRHTYLRVLYPLLAHTQLRQPPQYKREEIRKLLSVLARGQPVGSDAETAMSTSWGHFEEVDDTTKRLVGRCQKVTWLADPESDSPILAGSPTEERSEPGSPISPVKSRPPALPAPRKLTKRKISGSSALPMGPYLRPQMEGARQSSLSMMEIAAQREKPGVITPSRNPALKEGLRAAIFSKKEKPPPPVTRRSTWSRRGLDRAAGDTEGNSTTDVEEAAQTAGTTDALPEERASRPVLTSTPSEIITIAKTTAPEHKKPPPAPKSRRWRGKSKNEEDETIGRKIEPGKFSSNLPSIITTPSPEERRPDVSPFSPVEEKALTMSPPPADHQPKASVKDALGEAQAEAVSGIRETLEKAHLGSDVTVEEQDPSPLKQEITPPRGILAPPGHVQRGVPGPRFEMERSPFLSDHEEVSEEDEWNDAPDTREEEV
jgi:hypothetical protein